MTETHQTAGVSVMQHGINVRAYYVDLIDHLTQKTALKYQWRLPDWVNADLLQHLLPDSILEQYQIFHDCGKPYCRTVDEAGKQHFPDHAAVSARIAEQIGFCPRVVACIAGDMDVHLLNADHLEEFCARPEAVSLLLTGLAEIHSNASMFGGIESVSFKIKWKQINKRGKQILDRIKNPS